SPAKRGLSFTSRGARARPRARPPPAPTLSRRTGHAGQPGGPVAPGQAARCRLTGPAATGTGRRLAAPTPAGRSAPTTPPAGSRARSGGTVTGGGQGPAAPGTPPPGGGARPSPHAPARPGGPPTRPVAQLPHP